MENTLENKAKFFAQYWGQKTLIPNYEDFIFSHTVNEQILDILYAQDIIKYSFLELKPLSSITDEDAEGVAKIISESIHDSVTKELVEYYADDIKKDPDVLSLASFNTVDFLRSKGYALPWMGLSIQELENFGWIKLKSE